VLTGYIPTKLSLLASTGLTPASTYIVDNDGLSATTVTEEQPLLLVLRVYALKDKEVETVSFVHGAKGAKRTISRSLS
jgi:hypothetical protein